MKFIVDTQLPPRLATYLKGKGYDAIHTTHFKDGHLLADTQIILIAKEHSRTVITKDADFSEHFILKGAPPKVLLIEFGNISNRELIGLFDLHFPQVMATFREGSNLVIFRREEVVGY